MKDLQHEYLVPKYIQLIGSSLRNFKRVANDHWRFSCPVCGDSQKVKTKSRGEVYRFKGAYLYKCHNCGIAFPADKLIKIVNPDLYKEYLLERFNPSTKGITKDKKVVSKAPAFRTKSVLVGLDRVTDIDQSHPVWQYILSRKIPKDYWKDLYYTDAFKSWVNTIIPNKFESTESDEPRLVIPFFQKDGSIEVFQGRALGYSRVKYITIKLYEDSPKIFGLDRLDPSDTVLVLEGPIDSMFLRNAIATADAALYKFDDVDECIYVYDNEPRNREIVKHMEKTIQLGRKVCIWGKEIREKDINDMILAGWSSDTLREYIMNHSYSGLIAQLELTQWKKTKNERGKVTTTKNNLHYRLSSSH